MPFRAAAGAISDLPSPARGHPRGLTGPKKEVFRTFQARGGETGFLSAAEIQAGAGRANLIRWDIIRERTKAGLAAARARGRKHSLTPAQVRQAATLIKDPAADPQAIANTFGIHISTLYRYVSPQGEIRKMPTAK